MSKRVAVYARVSTARQAENEFPFPTNWPRPGAIARDAAGLWCANMWMRVRAPATTSGPNFSA